MCDYDFVRLVTMLFSGLITAVMVIVINEGLNYCKLRRRRRGILLMLVCELISNESLLTNYMEDLREGKTTFRYTVWEKSCIEVADFLTQRQLAELSAAYSLLRKIELAANPDNCQKAVSLLQRLQLQLGKGAGLKSEVENSR